MGVSRDWQESGKEGDGEPGPLTVLGRRVTGGAGVESVGKYPELSVSAGADPHAGFGSPAV